MRFELRKISVALGCAVGLLLGTLAAPQATATEMLICARADRDDPEVARAGSRLRVREACKSWEVEAGPELALCARSDSGSLRDGAWVSLRASCRPGTDMELDPVSPTNATTSLRSRNLAPAEANLCSRRDPSNPGSARDGTRLRVRSACTSKEVEVGPSLALCAGKTVGGEARDGAWVYVRSVCDASREVEVEAVTTPVELEAVATPVKPFFDWGYPEYSQYDADGKHVGKTLYQTDSACQTRLSFYSCAAVDGMTPNNPTTNPTGASEALLGNDSCAPAIVAEKPSYCMPADICNPSSQNPGWNPGQGSSDNLAWQLFIALNWPADPNQPGYPDSSADLGAVDPDGTQHASSVWLDYPTADQLFGVPSPCDGPTLRMDSKISPALQSKQTLNTALGDVVESNGGVLVDQAGNLTYFDIRVNRTIWEFVVNQNDYWQTGTALDGIAKAPVRNYYEPIGPMSDAFPTAVYPDSETGRLGDVGALEMKVSWKRLSEIEAASGDYYTREFQLYDELKPEGEQCSAASMGLVGLHAVYMPAQFGYPDWIWATFEHRKNVPTKEINEGETEFSYHDPSCTATKTPAECAAYNADSDDPADFRCCENLQLYANREGLPAEGKPVSNQVVRDVNPTVSTVLPTHCSKYHTQAITNHFGADNVWQNYFLVSTQWPFRSFDSHPEYEPAFPLNLPCQLRNTTMETFLSTTGDSSMNGCNADTNNPFCRWCNGDCVSTASAQEAVCEEGAPQPEQVVSVDCMSCHSSVAQQNSSFLFSHRPCCTRTDGEYPNTCGELHHQSACTVVSGCEWNGTDPLCTSN